MIRIAHLFFLFCLAEPLAAAPIQIKTGEHDDFTRVVLTIPTETPWWLGRNDTGYTLRMPVPDGFDTVGFFDLIPRDRITAVTAAPENGELLLEISCRCAADAFLYRPGVLVIDIRDGLPKPGSPFEIVLDQPSPPQVLPVLSEPGAPVMMVELPLLPFDIAMPEPEPAIEHVEGGSQLASDLDALERAVTESLARGMTQGLLETDLGPSAERALDEKMLRDALDALGANVPGLRATTSVDRDAIPSDGHVAVTQSGDVCMPDTYFDVGSWADGRPFGAQIAESRARLTGEFDRVDEDAVTNLARRFLHFGFGREARLVLRLDGINSQERQYLAAVGRIVDGDPVDEKLFARQVSCTGSVALWAALAQPEGALDATIDQPSVLRAFKALPFALQNHLGPQLSARFVAIGDSDGASQAMVVASASPDRPISTDLAETALKRALGDNQIAAVQLSDMANENVRMTPEGMILLFDEALKHNVPLRNQDFQLADALRFESAQLPVATELALAQARAYLHTDRFGRAEKLVRERITSIGEDRTDAVMDAFVQAAVARMGDADFLAFAFAELFFHPTDRARIALATRLLSLGFPGQADMFLVQPVALDFSVRRQELRGQAALDSGEPEAALAQLHEVDSSTAQSIRDIARSIISTRALVPNSNAAADTETGDWRGGNWDRLARSGDPLLEAASAAVLTVENGTLAADAPLASGRALLDRSARSREIVGDLLNRFAAPTGF